MTELRETIRDDIERLVVLGPAGTYLDGLASSMDLGYPIEYGQSLETMIEQAEASQKTSILLPIKNTLDGPLYNVVGAFQRRKLRIQGAVILNIVSNIMGIGTLKEAEKIGGKDVALGQITEFMPELERVVMPSTAAAGQHIQETGDRTMLAVGALAQAPIYGLDVLATGVQDPVGINRTTILIVRGRNGWKFDPETITEVDSTLAGAMLIGLNDSVHAGSLHRALGQIADRDINLTSIESLNVRGTERTEFFVTFSGVGRAIADLIADQRAAQYMNLDVLGVYDKPLTYDS